GTGCSLIPPHSVGTRRGTSSERRVALIHRGDPHQPACAVGRRMHGDGDFPDSPVIFPPASVGESVEVRLAPGQGVVAVDEPLRRAMPIDQHMGIGQGLPRDAAPGDAERHIAVGLRRAGTHDPMRPGVRPLHLGQRQLNRPCSCVA
ncbi:MAG: hypothetical protein ACK56I_25345, partial [bacterium]